MGNFYAIRATCVIAWKLAFVSTRFAVISRLFIIPQIALMAWVASSSDNPSVLAYISVGVFLMTIFQSSVTGMWFSLVDEYLQGTLDSMLVTRTPIMLVMFGKALGWTADSTISGLVATLTVLAVSQRLTNVDNIPLLLVSLSVAMTVLTASCFILSPFALLKGRAGIFVPLTFIGVVLSGFLYPVSLLPAGLQAIARCLPTSWAMDGVIRSVEGDGSTLKIAGDWIIALAMATVYLGVTYLMFKFVEKRLRYTGEMSTV